MFISYDIMGESPSLFPPLPSPLFPFKRFQEFQEMGSEAPQNIPSFTENLPGVLIRIGRTDEPTVFLLA